MTTIVYRDGVMAGDTALVDRGTYYGQQPKIFRHGNRLLGACGCLGAITALRDWFLAGAEGDPPELKDDDSEGLLVDDSGRVEWVGSGRKRMVIEAPFHAIGSGFRVALGAMAAGADAEQALEIACDLDIHTRRPITTLTHFE